MSTKTAEAPSLAADTSVINALLKRLISKRKLTDEDLTTVLDLTIGKVVEAVGGEAITVFLLEEKAIRFAHVYYSRHLYAGNKTSQEKFQKKAEELKAISLKPGQGIVGKVIETGKSHRVADVSQDPSFHGGIDKETGFVTRSMITVPLTVDGKAIGALQVLNKRSQGAFSPEDLALVEEVAGYSARMIQRVRDPEAASDDREMARYVSRLTRHELMTFNQDFQLDEKLVNLIGEPTLRRFHVLPLKKLSTSALRVAMANPLDIQKKDSFQAMTQLEIAEVLVAAESDIEAQLNQFFKKTVRPAGFDDVTAALQDQYKTTETIDMASDVDEKSTPIVELANRIIEDAYARGASDIHIEPFETEVLVRYRADGMLEEKLRLPVQACRALVARLKIMSELNISERRLPQDGRIKFKNFTKTGIDIDLRVSIGPMSWGEKVCMRILDKTSTALGLQQMGFSETNLKLYRKMIAQPYGMILHVGPTGSGKTTTLYSALNEINAPDINIQTAEDPIEYQLKGINQMQMHSLIGLTFASALRCFLRQDPDVILVGEMRDLETASIGIEAALTGHLLFSTLHTNDASGTVTRFLDMGVEPFLISSSLLCVCAQRLLRRLCKCKETYEPDPQKIKELDVDWPKEITLYRPKGCPACNNTGYKGRLGVHELLTMNDDVRDLVVQRASSEIIRKAAVKHGMITLYYDTLDKVRQGVTSLDEALMTVRKE
jgi:type IV pilus assembly protein PilB